MHGASGENNIFRCTEKYFALPKVSSMSSTLGRGYTFFLVTAFTYLHRNVDCHLFGGLTPLDWPMHLMMVDNLFEHIIHIKLGNFLSVYNGVRLGH